jgi:hypothetical protein
MRCAGLSRPRHLSHPSIDFAGACLPNDLSAAATSASVVRIVIRSLFDIFRKGTTRMLPEPDAARTLTTMNHRTLEKELTHLEYVITRIGINDPIPLGYWQARVAALSEAATLQTQRARVKKLGNALLALEQAANALRVPPPPALRVTLPPLVRRPRRLSGTTAAPSAHDFDQLQVAD